MRYILTKDGRISYLSQEPYEDMDCYEIITSKGTLTYRREDEVVKIADTIEELFDEFVWNKDLIDIDFNNKKVNIKNDDYEFDLDYCLKNGNIYGAIWTDRGLIYKAKMKGISESGKTEWELL